MLLSLLLVLHFGSPPAPPDTLVVCPAEFRAALAPWEALRRQQGHELAIIEPPRDTAELQTIIRRAAALGRLQHVVLIGDAAGDSHPTPDVARLIVPTNYVPAKVNARWGGPRTIASDTPYADVNDDGVPDLAVGRIPADSPSELAVAVRKIIRYELETNAEGWDRQLSAVAGLGGFGAMADALIEAAGQQIMGQAVPPGYLVSLTRANTNLRAGRALGPARLAALPAGRADPAPAPNPFPELIARQMNDGCLVWVYLGHGQRTALDYVAGPRGPEPILSVDDVQRRQGGARCPLAVLIACDTGAYDVPGDSLAEELLLSEAGPVAVVAASRISMPYGNTVFGYELLRAGLVDRPLTLGATIRLAQQRTLGVRADDPLRKSFDTLAVVLNPILQRGEPRWKPDDLATERSEHIAMYQLFGDPLLRWRRPGTIELSAPDEVPSGGSLKLEGTANFDGECVIEVVRVGPLAPAKLGASAADVGVVASASTTVRGGRLYVAVPLPTEAAGPVKVRAYLRGPGGSAVGGAVVVVRRADEGRGRPAAAAESAAR